jgi:hypothetical protein
MIIHKEKITGRENAMKNLLPRKIIPMIICRMADRARVALLGMKAWVLKVKMSLEIPENKVKRPMSQAVVNKVAAGLVMQKIPRAMSRIPVIASQILVLVFIIMVIG